MNVAKLRQDLGYNQAKFREELGVSGDVLVDLERYTIVPSPVMREQIKRLRDKHNLDMSKYEMSEVVRHLLRTRPTQKKRAID